MSEWRHWAFISYSHQDAAVATRLQRDLEGYRVPQRLVGRETSLGALPKRLRPVYRDRDELRAGADLGGPIAQALAGSRWLIVVCSPAAAHSEWVRQEIVQFKTLHGADATRRVLAVIAQGEPWASRQPGRADDECLPLPLRFALDDQGQPCGAPLEPVAADLRAQGDGRRRATLKLLAAMMDVGFDELVRRDLRRRLRWASAIALGSSLGMVALGGMAVLATQARNEARTQRAEAEGLIEFMLGDLRRKLEPVGRLDVLDAVGGKALAHYDAQALDALDADALGRRARALHLIGEIRDKRGNLDEALAAFRSAADSTQALLARAPGDAQRVFDHAQSVYWVGYVAFRRGESQAAETAFQDYLVLAQRLVRLDAGKVDWQLEVAYAQQNIGVARLARGLAAEALQAFDAALPIYARALGERPALAFDLADALGWQSKARAALGRYEEALASLRARAEAIRTMPDAGQSRQVQIDQADTAYQMAGLYLDLGRLDDARAAAESSVRLAEALVALDSSNLLWLKQLCDHRLRLAGIALAQNQANAARTLAERVARDIERLTATDLTGLTAQVGLRGAWLTMAARLALQAGERGPVDELQAFLASVDAIEAGQRQLDSRQVTLVVAAELALGDLQAQLRRHDLAAVRWQSALRRLEAAGAAIWIDGLALRATCEMRLGQRERAAQTLARLRETTYRHPAYAELVNQLARGAGAVRTLSSH